jgi:hypothetical protein
MCLPNDIDQQTQRFKPYSLRTVSDLSTRCSSKKISFNESVKVRIIQDRSSEMTEQTKSRLYYSKDELRDFESEMVEIRNIVIRQARSFAKSNPAMSPAEHVSAMLESDDSLRGFEVRFCPTRVRNKAMILNAVLQYQKQLRSLEPSLSPEQREKLLSRAYSELIPLSTKDRALKTARKDEIQAYHIHGNPKPVSPSPHSGTKRNSYIEEEVFQKKCKLCR